MKRQALFGRNDPGVEAEEATEKAEEVGKVIFTARLCSALFLWTWTLSQGTARKWVLLMRAIYSAWAELVSPADHRLDVDRLHHRETAGRQ